MTLREVSRSVRWPKLLHPRPTAETRRPEPPRLRICMDDPVGSTREEGGCIVARAASTRKQRRQSVMTFLRIVIPLYLFDLSMIFSENRYPFFRIMLSRPPGLAAMRHKKMRPRSDAA